MIELVAGSRATRYQCIYVIGPEGINGVNDYIETKGFVLFHSSMVDGYILVLFPSFQQNFLLVLCSNSA